MSLASLDAFSNSIETEELQVRAVSLSEFLSMELPPRENLLNPWLPRSGLCMVYAKRGVGKTFFALEIAMTLAYGADFLSFTATKPVKVLYIDGEMPANTMQKRLAEIENRMSANEKMIEPFFITPDLQGNFMPDLSTLDGQESIREQTNEADLIIVDNISTLGGSAKENEAESWIPLQQWALSLRKQGKSVLFVHHAAKNGNQRGTSKREDVLDTVIVLKHPSDYEPSDGACFELHFEKARGMVGDCVNPIRCRLTDEGWRYESLEQNNYQRVVALANEGLSQKEIAIELELSKSQVSKLHKKARGLGEVKKDG
ncbi:MAG: AAA family ATPase [Gammaproteobacteria bacterium]|nr:AAA family ATPase [Gammaproteobacteria bacterium]